MNPFSIIRQTVERSNRVPSPKKALKEEETDDLSLATQELGVWTRDRVFQIIEDRVGAGGIRDLSVLDPVTEAIARFMADVNPKIAEVIEALGGVTR